jgi:hypothetical protein
LNELGFDPELLREPLRDLDLEPDQMTGFRRVVIDVRLATLNVATPPKHTRFLHALDRVARLRSCSSSATREQAGDANEDSECDRGPEHGAMLRGNFVALADRSRMAALLRLGRAMSLISRSGVAAECRAAALEFMTGVAEGWSKFDLALWLCGSYSIAARHLGRSERVSESAPPIEPMTIEHLLVHTRSQVLAALELAALPRTGHLDFMEVALVRQHVIRATRRDEREESVWVPVDRARMRLRDRVQSLFVADCLNAPNDYQHLYVCHHCERIVFEPGARERGSCGTERAPKKTLTYRK